jgi:hypothetical protein
MCKLLVRCAMLLALAILSGCGGNATSRSGALGPSTAQSAQAAGEEGAMEATETATEAAE